MALLSILVIVIIIIIIIKLYIKLTTGINKSNACLLGKTAIVTGGNQGIGYQVVLGLAARGCRVIIADKDDSEKSRAAVIEETGNPNIISKTFDLGSIESVRLFVKDILKNEKRLDILVNNAGCCGFANDVTPDDMNKMMQINHFGPFLLTHLLVGLLKSTPDSRIIFTSSIVSFVHCIDRKNINNSANVSHEYSRSFLTYNNSKTYSLLASNYFAEKLKPHGITSNASYPGMVCTNFLTQGFTVFKSQTIINRIIYTCSLFNMWFLGKTAQEGAQTTLHLATSNEVQNVSGKFFVECRAFIQPLIASNKEFCQLFKEQSIKLVKLTDQEINM